MLADSLTQVASLLHPVRVDQISQPVLCQGTPRGRTVRCGHVHRLGSALLQIDREVRGGSPAPHLVQTETSKHCHGGVTQFILPVGTAKAVENRKIAASKHRYFIVSYC